MWVAQVMSSSVRGWERMSRISMSHCRSASTPFSLGRCPYPVATPALETSMSLRLRTACRNNPSAMGERQMFPVHTKRTRFLLDTIERRKLGAVHVAINYQHCMTNMHAHLDFGGRHS